MLLWKLDVLNHLSLAERFWLQVEKIPEHSCWEWTGSIRTRDGYGGIKFQQRSLLAHRVAWELHNGPILNGLCVLHRCDNPTCVRPDHLFLGTLQDNAVDMQRKGRGSIHIAHAERRRSQLARTHCRNGHPFTPDNLYPSDLKAGRRTCRTCHAATGREYYRARKARSL